MSAYSFLVDMLLIAEALPGLESLPLSSEIGHRMPLSLFLLRILYRRAADNVCMLGIR